MKKMRAKKNPADGAQIVLTLETDGARADELFDWLGEAFARPVVQLARPGESRVWLEVYFVEHAEAALAEKIAMKRGGVRATNLRVTKPRDWLTFWKHHFKPQNIGAKLRICPVWSPGAARAKGRKTILVDPGMSFGTGEHFTTRFCLEMVDRLCHNTAPASMLDIGTGSGILAIAALKLGCRRAIGTDNDAVALEQAKKNARLNRVGANVKFRVQDITAVAPREKFDLVCANILTPLLVQVAPAISRLAKRHLVLSGIREFELDGVAEAYMQQGGREIARDGDGEWGGLLVEFGKR